MTRQCDLRKPRLISQILDDGDQIYHLTRDGSKVTLAFSEAKLTLTSWMPLILDSPFSIPAKQLAQLILDMKNSTVFKFADGRIRHRRLPIGIVRSGF